MRILYGYWLLRNIFWTYAVVIIEVSHMSVWIFYTEFDIVYFPAQYILKCGYRPEYILYSKTAFLKFNQLRQILFNL